MDGLSDDDKVSLILAAMILGISPFTLRSWIRERRIPFYRCGRRIIFSRRDLEAFLSRCRVTPRES